MAWTKTYTGDEPLRINKWLAQEGVCSRREADALIEKGLIQLDGKPVTVAGERVTKGQTLSLTDAASRRLDNQLSVILNKPVGYVSGTPEPGEIPAIRLISEENLSGSAHAIPQRSNKMAPLGRLDKDSHGLLILSEDGVLAKAIIGPLSDMDKEYLVKVRGDITTAKVALLRHGLELDGRQLRPAEVTQERGQVLRFVLKEGRNRQIRRMCELVELRVLDLQRIRVGPILLAGLPQGKWRPLGAKERAALLAAGAGEEVRSSPARREDRLRTSDGPRRERSETGRDQPRTDRDRSGQFGTKPGQGRPDKPRTGPKPDRAGAKPARPGAKPARPGAKPTAAPAPEGPSNRPSVLKGDKFKRTKLPPRERKPIK
ncbi:Ribosomal large subunit pseudouridine synthase F [Hyphomonas neptunium ATCC 15444]|uniref:Dual-specificity RNA pseudouridine synthase RluF n=2 Tax=Hyphomonas TaxID=85 RepID=Q0C148_HYPNA|nr:MULTISPECIES: pseudouridine synthase [Hyphomonas]ABI78124.1 Ribosomal large subunit pseudouridine synthase F [Hyphomonas neptunium ATCC 15444]KCZ95040.1 ribosomal large subunit pseudouridine synthase F [Hyphomonas hirschiana VP5]